jgi:hypothetical protein
VTDKLQDKLAGRMTIRPVMVTVSAFGSDLEHESSETEEQDLEGRSDAEKEWHEEFEEHYDEELPVDFKWEEASDYGIEVPEGGLTDSQRYDLSWLYARSSPVDEAIWYAVNAYHWHEADWLKVLNSDNAFDAFMRTQRDYYEDCLTDSQLIGQTAECAGVEQTKAAIKKSESVFGNLDMPVPEAPRAKRK